MLPPIPVERISFVGNAAGVGAQMALTDERERRRVAQLRQRIAFLELATHSEFHAVFAEQLAFTAPDVEAEFVA
jgi:uncharacterized 2Fe-2S/4Fe-4S cluster protein (DUF4445 family)